MNNPIITISDLHISFKNNEILKNINLTINKGDFIYLIGGTGSGKSSLLKSLYKEIDFQKGSISVAEFNLIKSLAKYPGVVKDRNQLMDTMYGDSIYVDDRTIDSHIKRLRKKFKSYDPDFDQIRTRYGSGYSWRE